MKSIVYLFCFALFIFSTSSFSQETKVSINKTSNGFQLIKNNEPYYIKGAGAKSNFKKVFKTKMFFRKTFEKL